MNKRRLLEELEEGSSWDKISGISGIVYLISFVLAVINWVGKNMTMDSFFTISYIALIVTSVTAIYSNVLTRRKNKDLNQEIVKCGEKSKDAVQAVYDFKNKELEDYKKDAEKRATDSRILIESVMNRDREQFNEQISDFVIICKKLKDTTNDQALSAEVEKVLRKYGYET